MWICTVSWWCAESIGDDGLLIICSWSVMSWTKGDRVGAFKYLFQNDDRVVGDKFEAGSREWHCSHLLSCRYVEQSCFLRFWKEEAILMDGCWEWRGHCNSGVRILMSMRGDRMLAKVMLFAHKWKKEAVVARRAHNLKDLELFEGKARLKIGKNDHDDSHDGDHF